MLFETVVPPLCDEMVLNIPYFLLCLFMNIKKVFMNLFLVCACNSFITLHFVVSELPKKMEKILNRVLGWYIGKGEQYCKEKKSKHKKVLNK